MPDKSENTQLSSAPKSMDIELVSNYFCEKCNCYAYAVQDYLAGYFERRDPDDCYYLPRPGQTRGNHYMDLCGDNVDGMRRAVHEDGLMFAGKSYPKRIPKGHYVICCFLDAKEYHFIRQNRDGSWSSKNGYSLPTTKDAFGEPLTNPENFYHGDKSHYFVGYFFVPEGGIQVGVKGYENLLLKSLKEGVKDPRQQKQINLLESFCVLNALGKRTVQLMQEKFRERNAESAHEVSAIWESYVSHFDKFMRAFGPIYNRRNLLKIAYTRPKNNPKNKKIKNIFTLLKDSSSSL